MDETDPTPPEYDLFKIWFYGEYPEGDAMLYQRLYRAFQAGYQVDRLPQPEADREAAG
jgi:hypothetical protein